MAAGPLRIAAAASLAIGAAALLLARADAAFYEAKQQGRARVVAARTR